MKPILRYIRDEMNYPMKKLLIPLLSFAFVGVATVARAEESPGDHKLSQWSFGKVLFGEKFSKKDLKGKVVLIENWGVRCPPCIGAMPHLAELDKDFREDGLVVIGAECQGHGKSDIEPILKKAKVEFAITEGAEGPIDFSSIPRCHLFNREGQIIYDGYPDHDKLKSLIRKALKEGAAEEEVEKDSNAPLIASKSWTNSEGVAIKAAVKSVDDKNVVFIMPNNKEVTYPLEKLSETSRDEIKAAASSDEKEEESDEDV